MAKVGVAAEIGACLEISVAPYYFVGFAFGSAVVRPDFEPAASGWCHEEEMYCC